MNACSLADTEEFKKAIELTRSTPDFKHVCTKTLSTTRLTARHKDANEYKLLRLKAGLKFGFLYTSDGWRGCNKTGHHNHLLVSCEGPLYLTVRDVTGQRGNADVICDEICIILESLSDVLSITEEEEVKILSEYGGGTDPIIKLIEKATMLGVLDTPAANQKASRLIEAKKPHMCWINCMAHEVSLLFGEWRRKVLQVMQIAASCMKITKWINNHSQLLSIFRQVVQVVFADDKRKWKLTLYTPGDTRMATIFKLAHKTQYLWQVLKAVVNKPEYDALAQEICDAYNKQCKDETKLVMQPN